MYIIYKYCFCHIIILLWIISFTTFSFLMILCKARKGPSKFIHVISLSNVKHKNWKYNLNFQKGNTTLLMFLVYIIILFTVSNNFGKNYKCIFKRLKLNWSNWLYTDIITSILTYLCLFYYSILFDICCFKQIIIMCFKIFYITVLNTIQNNNNL